MICLIWTSAAAAEMPLDVRKCLTDEDSSPKTTVDCKVKTLIRGLNSWWALRQLVGNRRRKDERDQDLINPYKHPPATQGRPFGKLEERGGWLCRGRGHRVPHEDNCLTGRIAP